jgi:hypothetical protein
MPVSKKYQAAIAVAALILMPFSAAAYSQSQSAAGNLAASVRGAGLQQGPGDCLREPEYVPAPQRFALTEASCDSRPVTGPTENPCTHTDTMTAGCQNDDDRIPEELLAMGERGETIAQARAQVLQILESENACSAWFQQVNPDVADTFRSLHFVLDEGGPSYVNSIKNVGQRWLSKQPYVASSMENAGRNAVIQLNANGAFFKRVSEVLEQDRPFGPVRRGGIRTLSVASYSGNSTPSQITTMLHELGHITGRLPADHNSWDGESARNTTEVLRFCRPAIKAVGREPHHGTSHLEAAR